MGKGSRCAKHRQTYGTLHSINIKIQLSIQKQTTSTLQPSQPAIQSTDNTNGLVTYY